METTPGKRVQIFREHKGYKRASAFAEAAGLKVATLSSIETDRTAPSFDSLAALASAFPDLNIDWLLTGAGPMLRDGRTLSPAPAPQPDRPAPLRTEPGQVDFVNKYITRLENDLEAAADREAYYQARIQELLGKPSGNLAYAAEPTADYVSAPAPIGFRPLGSAVVRAMWPAGVLAEVTHKRVG